MLGTDFDGAPRDAGPSSAETTPSEAAAGHDATSGTDASPVEASDAVAPPDAAPDGEDATAPKTVTAVACGTYFTCAVANGDVYCFGDNKASELGNPEAGAGGPTPVHVPLPGPATQVAAHGFFACASVDKEIYCWGANDSGELGSGSNNPTNVSVPAKVNGLRGEILSLAAGGSHACAVVDGSV